VLVVQVLGTICSMAYDKDLFPKCLLSSRSGTQNLYKCICVCITSYTHIHTRTPHMHREMRHRRGAHEHRLPYLQNDRAAVQKATFKKDQAACQDAYDVHFVILATPQCGKFWTRMLLDTYVVGHVSCTKQDISKSYIPHQSVMSHIRMYHVPCMDGPCRRCECVVSHI